MISFLLFVVVVCSSMDKVQCSLGEPPLIPREKLLTLDVTGGFVLSPNGKWISWVALAGKSVNVFVRQLPDGEPEQLTQLTQNHVIDHAWLADDNMFFLTGIKPQTFNVINVNDMKSREVASFNVDAKVLNYNTKHPNHVMIGLKEKPPFFNVYELNMTDGHMKPIVDNNRYFKEFYFDNNMKIRLAENHTDKPRVMANFYKIDTDSGKVEFFKSVDYDDFRVISFKGFDITNKKMYWLDDDDDEKIDLPSLFEIDYNSNEKKLVFQARRGVISETLFHPTKGQLIYVAENYARTERYFFDEKYEKQFREVRQQLPQYTDFVLLKYSNDFRTWILMPYSDIVAPSFYVYFKNRVMLLSDASMNQFKPAFATKRILQIPVSDNLTEVCYLTLPLEADPSRTGFPTKPWPMVLYIHGGPKARSNWMFSIESQFLANRGYAALDCNFRGSFPLGRNFLRAGFAEMSRKMQNDLTSAVQYAIDHKIADKKKVAIFGASYGGYATLVGMATTPDLYQCGVECCGISNYSDALYYSRTIGGNFYQLERRQVGGDLDTEDGRKFLNSISPLYYVKNIKKPLMIFHGGKDMIVKISHSENMVQAMREKGKHVTYTKFPDEAHGFDNPRNKIVFYGMVENFLKKCLGGRAEPLSDEDVKKSTAIINEY